MSQLAVFTQLNPLQLSLLTGVISSSYFICGNLGAAFFGIVPAIQDEGELEVKLPIETKVALWKFFYDRAKVSTVMLVISIMSPLLTHVSLTA